MPNRFAGPHPHIQHNGYLIGAEPDFLITNEIEGLDAETLDEFEMAYFLYVRRFGQR